MSAVEKVKKKKERGTKGSSKGKNKKTTAVVPEAEDKQLIIENITDEVKSGSVISVQEAKEDAKQDFTDKEKDNDEFKNQESPDPEASTSKNISRPTSGMSQHSEQLGSTVSVKSKEAWTDNRISTISPNDNRRRSSNLRSLQSQGHTPLFAPAEMNESHAYVPFLYARDTVAKITEDMKKMKMKHVDIIRQIDLNYKNIEEDTQTHFNVFVVTLQQKYVQKVKTFRQVIEVHRLELQRKQQYWDEMLQSLRQRNKQLLNEKKQLLILNKQQREKLEQDKESTVKNLTQKLSDKEKEILLLKEKMRIKEQQFEEDKERELKNMEKTLKREWDKERQEMEETIEELRSNPITVATVQSLQQSSAPSEAKLVAELKRNVQEKDAMILLCKEESGAKDAEHKKEKTVLQQEIKKLEQQNSKLKKKLSGDVTSDSGLEKQVDDLEEKVMQLEIALKAAEIDKEHHMNISKDQKDYIADIEDQLSAINSRVSELQITTAEYEKSTIQLNTANRELEKLKKKIKKLEDELEKKDEEMSDQELKADKLRSEMEKDMKKMLKEISKLRKQLEEKEEPSHEPSSIEKKMEKMETNAIDFEHKIAILTSDRDYYTNRNKVLKERVTELAQELYTTEKMLAQVRADAVISSWCQKQNTESQQSIEDQKQTIKVLKQELLHKQQELHNLENNKEHAILEETKKQKKMAIDIKKLTKQIKNLEKQLKQKEGEDVDQESKDETIKSLQDRLLYFEREHDVIKQQYKDMKDRTKDLEKRLMAAEENLHQMEHNADIAVDLEAAEAEVKMLKKQLQDSERQLTNKQQKIEEIDAALKYEKSEIKMMQQEHSDHLREKEKLIKELEKEIRKLQWQLAKLREKLGISDKDSPADMGKEMIDLEEMITELEKRVIDLEAEKESLREEINSLNQTNKQLDAMLKQQQEKAEIQESGVPLAMSTPVPSDKVDSQELNQQIEELQKEVDQKEIELREERTNHRITKEELQALTDQLETLKLQLENQQIESEANLEVTENRLNAEIQQLKERLSVVELQKENMEKDQLADIPPDTAAIIADLRAKLKEKDEERVRLSTQVAELKATVKTLETQIKKLEKSSKGDKTRNDGVMDKFKQLKLEKEKEIRQIMAEAQKKEELRAAQEKKRINALEQKIRQLEVAGIQAPKDGGGQNLQALQVRLHDAKQEISELKTKNKQLETDLRRSGVTAGGMVVNEEAEKKLKKQAKVLKEMEKIIEMEKQKSTKNEEKIRKLEEELKSTQKDLKEKENELEKLKTEMAALGVSAKEAQALSQEVEKLKAEVKTLTKENKILAENFNSERVLRKKYYNMVEDMKGKIRVYCRVRPLSSSELQRGSHSVVKSPDEYTIMIESQRGTKEFQFDQVFMPEASQEKIFEDANNLVQSAVDGYNVCIFAYGQTGSGKTYTIIGDREQKHPGIAPRAFERIFELLKDNKTKFSYKCSCYMLELYNDRLIDLFTKPSALEVDKLEIKRDQKGMVYVQGAEVKSAKNAQQLAALFEEGSKNRHTASTKMNLESSRSHLVIGIIIETTNRTTGAVLKGKLSLVDLAGSERAAKTEASAEQLKEAMSINKSLSALGDVISALSSEQQFIPYRNNKLTMLMQDSLGGNAKTLMFVNISPADYNADESVVSLTYASRVKLITNDAQKNAENKEIARLKNIIAKLKKGESHPEADEID